MNERAVVALAVAAKRLAAAADLQAEYLRGLGVYPSVDELALEFDDALAGASPALTDACRMAAQRLDQMLDEISGEANAGLWTAESLADSEEWGAIRRQAVRLVSELDNAGVKCESTGRTD